MFMADIVLQKIFKFYIYIMYMYMLQIQVHKYFSDFGNEDEDEEINLHTPGTVLLYNTLFSLY